MADAPPAAVEEELAWGRPVEEKGTSGRQAAEEGLWGCGLEIAGASSKLWGGRFTGATDPLMTAYNESITFDKAFYAQDIAGSIAFARANVKTRILTKDEFVAIEGGLRKILKEWETNQFEIKQGELIGKDIAGELHTGRSRNDQVATDMRLWLRDQLKEVLVYLTKFLTVLADRAAQDIDYIMPGYTHLQRAQLIRWSHWLLSYGVAFSNDLERLREVYRRVNRSPLGCGALAGNAFGIDRYAMQDELQFHDIIPNSMSAVGDRDFVLEVMQWGSTLMLHMSRLSEISLPIAHPNLALRDWLMHTPRKAR